MAPIVDVTAALEVRMIGAARPAHACALIVLGLLATWWIYVPVHELLHALGCWATGGTVTELQIAPEYGGGLLARILPFVTAGGDYAGRLSGFDTHGQDLTYLATDALPFVLTVAIGVPLLRGCRRPGRPALLGAAVVLAFAPFYSLPGDYYEMGSILVTRAVAAIGAPLALTPATLAALRSDDVVRLIADLWQRPAVLHLEGTAQWWLAALVILAAQLLAVVLALATYAAGASLAPPQGQE
jgi:hypothetical protein